MKILFIILTLVLSSVSVANEAQLGKFHGLGIDGKRCFVIVEEVYNTGYIFVRDSYFPSRPYALRQIGRNKYRLDDTSGYSGTVVEATIDNFGNLTYYNRAELQDIVFTHIVYNHWCKISSH